MFDNYKIINYIKKSKVFITININKSLKNNIIKIVNRKNITISAFIEQTIKFRLERIIHGMKELTFKKGERRITMSISIDKTLRKDIVAAAKQEGLSVSSFIEQVIRFAMPEEKKEIAGGDSK